jgi:hypothetical protein
MLSPSSMPPLNRCWTIYHGMVLLVWRVIPSISYYVANPISRFILNLPDEELMSIERVCFQVEQA